MLLISGCEGTGGDEIDQRSPGELVFRTSDPALQAAFDWAKTTALGYAFTGDPVGPWYEASLPGREAFCMRDVSHQASGAYALGLHKATANMLGKFAENISESKDWCSYWEITRYDEPAAVDYRSDEAFWYNLPANFDVLDAMVRMYKLSGDSALIDSEASREFMFRTMVDYPERWQIARPADLLTRPRFLNRDSFNLDDPYEYARGIPTYHEDSPGNTQVGVDLAAFLFAANRAYSVILEERNDVDGARKYRLAAEKWRTFVLDTFWNPEKGRFDTIIRTDKKRLGVVAMEAFLLYTDLVTSPGHIEAVLDALRHSNTGIEMISYFPEIFYRYGRPEKAYDYVLYLADQTTDRREYPEVSFSVIGSVVFGLMGVTLTLSENRINTRPNLTRNTSSATLEKLPCGNGFIGISHKNTTESALEHSCETALTWVAEFPGNHQTIWFGPKATTSTRASDRMGGIVSTATFRVQPGKKVTATVRP